MVSSKASNTDAMSGPTNNVKDVNILTASNHGYAIVPGSNSRLRDLDFLRATNVDAVGVGAVGWRHYFNMADVHVIAGEKVEMSIFAID